MATLTGRSGGGTYTASAGVQLVASDFSLDLSYAAAWTVAQSWTVDDANRTTNTDILTLTHTTSDALFGGNSMAAGILFRLEDGAGNTDDAVRMGGRWVDATSTSEDSEFFIQNRIAGAALTDRAKVSSTRASFRFGGAAYRDTYFFEAQTDTIAATLNIRSTAAAGVGAFYAQADSAAVGLEVSHFGTAHVATFLGASMANASRVASSLVLMVGSVAGSNSDVLLGANDVEFMRLASGGGVRLSVPIEALDAATNTVTDIVTLTHHTSGAAAAGFGTGMLFRGEDDGGTLEDMARAAAVWTVATSGTEESRVVFQMRYGGAVLATQAQIIGIGHFQASTAETAGTATAQFGTIADPNTGLHLPGALQCRLMISGTDHFTVAASYAYLISSDAATNSITDVFTFDHTSSGAAAAGFGTGLLFIGEDAGGAADDMGRLAVAWSTATAGSEASYFTLSYRVAGAALTERTRFSPVTGMAHDVSDAATNTTSDVLTLTHSTSGTAAASYGVGLLMTGEDAAGNTDDMARLGTRWITATSTAEDSLVFIQGRGAGAALADIATFRTATATAAALQIPGNANARHSGMLVYNDSAGTGAFCSIEVSNNSASSVAALAMYAMGSGFTTNGGFTQDAGVIRCGSDLAGGLNVIAEGGPIRFYAGGFAAANQKFDVRSDADGAKVTALYVNENGTLKRVTIGANGSGGAGLSALVVVD